MSQSSMVQIRLLANILIISSILGLGIGAPASIHSPIKNTPTPPPPIIELVAIRMEIEQAIQQAVLEEDELAPIFVLLDTHIDHLAISEDKKWAIGWLNPKDPKTGSIIPAEPGLTVIKKKGQIWKAILPGNEAWGQSVQEAPSDILSKEEKYIWLEMNTRTAALAASVTFNGYRLPWAGGVTMAMTQSVGHDRYTPSGNAHYAFDFATSGASSMFNLYAAKTGKVKQAKDDCSNGSETCSNWLVLEDTSTSPTTYQLYLHLAKGSIPSSLKIIGTRVSQGQFIGVADDTGVSTGHHLHFMVHSNPYSYWGTSVDVSFEDVTINGGRPRIPSDLPYCRNDENYHDVCDTFNYYYVSGNYPYGDQIPPVGDILNPLTGLIVESNIVHLEGWATDNQSGLSTAQFIAKYNENWYDIGSPFTTSLFSMDWDLCNASVPDGPISIALRLRDNAGNQTLNLPGLRHFTKNYNCPIPPPTCSPSNDQVALFTDSDYKGVCVVLPTGSYPNATYFGPLEDNSITSIEVGSNVQATLYFNNNYQGRGETLPTNDSNLSDNVIGADSVSSILVKSRSTAPSTPSTVWPSGNPSFPAQSSLSLTWDNGGNAIEFQAKFSNQTSGIITAPWQTRPYWNLGSLNTGTYTWQVRGRNSPNTSAWSNSASFIIATPSSSMPDEITVPFTDTMEISPSSWTRSPYWDLTTEKNHTPYGNISWKYDINSRPEDGYDTGAPNSGDLTSPPISLPAESDYYLRFWYWYETENPGIHWDQRWVQLSIDNGPFSNTFQLLDDPAGNWLQSPAIPLGLYAGHVIRIRFHFETMDKWLNRYKGWYIDDVSIVEINPPSCSDPNEPNNTPSQATNLTYNNHINGDICPGGDVDYYTFIGSTNDQVGAIVEAHAGNPTSQLDPYLFLYDQDALSILAENDDQILGQRTDSELTYNIQRSGNYYLKARAWDHPSVGGNDYNYTLKLYNDFIDPVAAFIYPQNGEILPDSVVTLSVVATDNISGISHVEFYWHSMDWNSGVWTLLGADWDGSNGWNIPYTVSQYSTQINMAFFARVYDRAGNWIGIGAWNISAFQNPIYFPTTLR